MAAITANTANHSGWSRPMAANKSPRRQVVGRVCLTGAGSRCLLWPKHTIHGDDRMIALNPLAQSVAAHHFERNCCR